MAEESEAALAFGFCLSTRSSIPMPNKALTAEPASTPIFAAFNPTSPKASASINKAIVKPIPARKEPATTIAQFSPSGQFCDAKSNGDPAESDNPYRLTYNQAQCNCDRNGIVETRKLQWHASIGQRKYWHDAETAVRMQRVLEILKRRNRLAANALKLPNLFSSPRGTTPAFCCKNNARLLDSMQEFITDQHRFGRCHQPKHDARNCRVNP